MNRQFFLILAYTSMALVMVTSLLPALSLPKISVILFGVLIAAIWGTAGVALIYFIRNLHKDQFNPAGSERRGHLQALIISFLYLLVQFPVLGIFGRILIITLLIAQWSFWSRYPSLPNRTLSRKEKLNSLKAPAIVLLTGGVIMVLVGFLSPPSPIKLADGLIIIMTFPVTITYAIGISFYPFSGYAAETNHNNLQSLATGKLIALFDWKQPKNATKILDILKHRKEYSLVLPLEKLKEKLPRAWFQVNKATYDSMHSLKNTMDQIIENIIAPNAPFQQRAEECWCKKCKARPKIHPVGKHSITLCRICGTDANLIFPLQKAVGVIANGQPEPPATGIWQMQSWNPADNTFIPADYDEILPQNEPSINLDWYLTAMAAWLDPYFAATGKAVAVSWEKGVELSENALAILKDAEQDGKLIRVQPD